MPALVSRFPRCTATARSQEFHSASRSSTGWATAGYLAGKPKASLPLLCTGSSGRRDFPFRESGSRARVATVDKRHTDRHDGADLVG
jgi:hypothetical protein